MVAMAAGVITLGVLFGREKKARAETENVLENARGKRIRKHARMIVANNARSAIGCDMNEAMIVTADKEVATGHVSKDKLAQTIIECIAEDLAKEV